MEDQISLALCLQLVLLLDTSTSTRTGLYGSYVVVLIFMYIYR